MLNSGCAEHLVYSYSVGASDDDVGYDTQVQLGDWTQTVSCEGQEGGSLKFYIGVR